MTTQLARYALAILSLTVATGGAAETLWLTDFKAAKARAKAENKPMLIEFTGSDWCKWCIKLDQEVLALPEFQSYAAREYILVKVDFPREKPLEKSQAKANQKLADQFKVQGFPTLILANPAGKELGRIGYEPGGAAAVTASLKSIAQGTATGPVPTLTVHARETRPPGQPPSKTASPGSVSSVEPSMAGLVLQGLSGPAHRRLALINNKTLGVGESARLRAGKREVQVRCLEIKEESVLVSVEGFSQPQELRLRGGL